MAMDDEKHHKPLTEILSPSKITDYFCSKTVVQNADEFRQRKDSSVYLTPKSSPAKDKDNEENRLSQDLAHSDTEGTTALKESQSSTKASTNGRVCESHAANIQSESPKKCSRTVVRTHETRTSSRLNGCSQDDATTDTSKRKSNQHRICQITRGHAINPDKDSSVPSSPLETAAISSPSLPRPKVRKNSKLKPVKAESQSDGTTQPAGPKPRSGRRKKPEPVQSTAITDYFPIRRSGRQTKSQIEKETLIHLEKLIKSGCEDGLEVKEFEGKGRGVVATKMFDKGDYVIEYAGDLLDLDTAKEREAHYALTPSIGCYMYFFSHKNKQYCVDATSESGRLGRLINHSRNGNCGTKVVMVDGEPRLILVAARYIKDGEELSYDYGDRSKAAVDAHPWLKL